MIYLAVFCAVVLLFIVTEVERKRANKQQRLKWRRELDRLIAGEREEQAEVEELERMMNVERRSR